MLVVCELIEHRESYRVLKFCDHFFFGSIPLIQLELGYNSYIFIMYVFIRF